MLEIETYIPVLKFEENGGAEKITAGTDADCDGLAKYEL